MKTVEKYCEFLGAASLPETPSWLPQKVYLPSESLGDFEKAILDSLDKDVEFSQSTYWSKDRFIKGNYHTGYKDSTAEGWRSFFQKFFGAKPLLHFHTHTVESGWDIPDLESESKDNELVEIWGIETYDFSVTDIASSKAFPRESYIELCGGPTGVVATLQTKQSTKLPISYKRERHETEKKLDRIDFFFLNRLRKARILEELGYGYYTWRPAQQFIQPGDLQNGIQLKKIY